MANSFNISVKPEIAAAVVKIDANKTALDLIRFTDFIYTNSLIAANETKIDTAITNIGTLIAMPWLENTTPLSVKIKLSTDSYVTVLNVASGSGFLTGISGCFYVAGNDNLDVKVTIDGTLLTGEHMLLNIVDATNMSSGFSYIARYETSLLVEAKMRYGTGAEAYCSVFYASD